MESQGFGRDVYKRQLLILMGVPGGEKKEKRRRKRWKSTPISERIR